MKNYFSEEICMYIFDTNPIYYLADPSKIRPDQYNKLRKKSTRCGITIGIPAVSAIELITRIYNDPSKFNDIKKSCELLFELKTRSMPDPTEMTERIVKCERNLLSSGGFNWNNILKTISKAPSLQDLKNGFVIPGSGVIRKIDFSIIDNFRASYESSYVNEMTLLATAFNSNYSHQIALNQPTKLSKSEQAGLIAFLSSNEWHDAFRNILEYRSNRILPTDPAKLTQIDERSRYFKLGYMYLIKKMFCDGTRPSLKNKNDYNDVHQLLYINDLTSDVIVTDDQGVLTKVGAANSKVITFSDFLALEAT